MEKQCGGTIITSNFNGCVNPPTVNETLLSGTDPGFIKETQGINKTIYEKESVLNEENYLSP